MQLWGCESRQQQPTLGALHRSAHTNASAAAPLVRAALSDAARCAPALNTEIHCSGRTPSI